MSGTVLLVDDDPRVVQILTRYLRSLDYEILAELTGAGGIESYGRHRPDVVVLDLDLPDLHGMEVLARLREERATVVMLTGTGDIETAVEAMRIGAENFLTKPIELVHLGAAVGRASEKARLRRENASLKARFDDPTATDTNFDTLGVSGMMKELADQLRVLSGAERATVLLTGETGTGKGWVADLVHRASGRADRPFVGVNCAGLTSTFLDSELFGHEKGAFTDAKERREGLFEVADRGTLFLDEIGDLAAELQPKLLKVLEDQSFRRLGGSREITVDVRLIAATHRDLARAVELGRFREDLFYRLNVTPIHLPAVRERSPDDRIALLYGLLSDLRRDLRRGPEEIGEDALGHLVAYPWPGNIREMRNVLERAVIFSGEDPALEVRHLPAEIRRAPAVRDAPGFTPDPLAVVERRHIERMLAHHDGNRTHAAKDLGIARATLINKIKAYRIDA